MWTELDLFKECARGAKQALDQHVYAAVWSAIQAWVVQQFASHRGASIAAFGRLTWHRSTAHASAAAEGVPPQLRPVFIPAENYLRTHALHHATSATRAFTTQPEELQPCEEYDGLRVALKFSRSLTRAVMEAGTRRLLAALGEAVRSGRQVSVDFGVGTLTGRDRALGFDFLPSYLAVHRTMAGSTRPGGAWASAAVGARRTAQQQQRQAAQQAPQQPPQTRREQVLAGLAQLQAELEAVEDGDAADEGGGVDFRDQALPGAPTQRWQRRESLPGEEAPGRQQQAGQRRAMSQPRRPLSQGPEAQGRQDTRHASPDPTSRARRDTSAGPQERPQWGRRVPPASAKSPGRQGAAASRPSSPGPTTRSRPLSGGARGWGAAGAGSQATARSAGPSRCASPGPERRGASAAGSARAQTTATQGRRPSSPGPEPRPNVPSSAAGVNGLSVGGGSRGSQTADWWSRGELSCLLDESGEISGRPFSPTPAERAAAGALPLASHIELANRAPRPRPVSPSPPMRRPASAPRSRAPSLSSRAAATTAATAARAPASRHSDTDRGGTQAFRAASAPRTRPVSAGARITVGSTKASGAPSRPTSPGPALNQPPMSAARAQALAVLRGRNASPGRAGPAHQAASVPTTAASMVAADPRPKKQLPAQLWSPDNSLKGATGRRATGAAKQGQRLNNATGTTVAGRKDAADTAPWLRSRNQVQQQDTAEPAANAAAGAGPAGESPVRRVSYDGGPAGTSGDIDVEDQQAPRSARKPLFVSPSGCNSPSYAAEGNAKSNGLRGMQPDRPLLNAHAGKGVAAGGAEDGRLHAKADDCTPSRLGRERLRDRSSPLDRSPSPGPRSGSRGVIVTLAAVRSASPGPNLRYGGAGAAADATGVSTAAFAMPLDSACEQAAHEVAGGRLAVARQVGGCKVAVEGRPLRLVKGAAAESPAWRYDYALHQQQPLQSCRTQPGSPTASATTDMAASAGPPSLQRPVTEGRPAGRDACVAESWEAELEAELEDVEDLLGGVEQYLGFSADLPDPWAQNADGNPLGRGWAEAEGPRRAAQAGGNSSAGGCVEDWSSSGMACSSSANSCFSFGCGGVGQASNSSSLRNTVHGVAGGRTGGPQALVSSTHGGALRACQEEEEDVSAGDCDSLPMPPQCCDSPTRRQLRSSGSQGEGDVAPIAAQGRRSPGERYRGGSSSSSTGTSRNSGGLRGVSLAVGEEDLPGPAWGDRRQAPAGGPHAKNQQEDQNESEEEEEEEEEDWSGDDQIPEVQRYLKSMGQVRGNWRLSSDESDVE